MIDTSEWEAEHKRLERVLKQIQSQHQELQNDRLQYKADIIDTRKYFRELTINLNEVLETSVNFQQQSREIARMERSYAHSGEFLRKLEKIWPSPYFGRIDFQEDGETKQEAIYIGLSTLIDEETDEILVYDWRAPISGLFYDYTLGRGEYATPEGTILGEIELKRQFIIKNSRIVNMFDTGLHIGDELLQSMLGGSANDRMKSIVTTIQREQNRIIRDDQHKVVFVQGAAGSGKTSIGLQRVAYFLYKHRNSWNAKNIVLFSPNRIFGDYVSNVLPELGENNMRQMTFQEYMVERLDSNLNIEDRYDQLERLFSQEHLSDYQEKVSAIRYKESMDFIKLLTQYLDLLIVEGMVFNDIVCANKIILSKEQLSELFYSFKAQDPVHIRLEKMQPEIIAQLDRWEEQQISGLYRKMLKVPTYIGTEKEIKLRSERRVRNKLIPVRQEVNQLSFVYLLQIYRQLFDGNSLFYKMKDAFSRPFLPDKWEAAGLHTAAALDEGIIPFEDAVPLVFLKESLEGFNASNDIKHVIVDEAQDYSAFQLALIKRLFPRSGFTLLGDANQAIHNGADQESFSFNTEWFGSELSSSVQLTKSYRSTKEIVEFTKGILIGGETIEAVERTGEKPWIFRVLSDNERNNAIIKNIEELTAAGAQSIAVICKTADESRIAYETISRFLPEVHLVTKNDLFFKKGVLILPSYLSKGLEFDAVVINNASAGVYGKESERRLLYTICTRALHHLHLFYVGERTPILDSVEERLYEQAVLQ